jgi:hypothetical protein
MDSKPSYQSFGIAFLSFLLMLSSGLGLLLGYFGGAGIYIVVGLSVLSTNQCGKVSTNYCEDA